MGLVRVLAYRPSVLFVVYDLFFYVSKGFIYLTKVLYF